MQKHQNLKYNLLEKKVNKLNKRFFELQNNLSVKVILEYLKISKDTFFKYNSQNNNNLNLEINQFSSLSNSFDDSLIFINKSIPINFNDVKGVCLVNSKSQKKYFQNNIIIPSENPKLDFCNLINQFCKKKEKKI